MNEQPAELQPPVNPNLVPKVTELLAAAGHPRPADWEQYVHPDALVVPDEGIQRFLINRYWRETLGALDVDTLNARYCLVQEGSVDDWVRAFREGVVKCIVANNVPPARH